MTLNVETEADPSELMTCVWSGVSHFQSLPVEMRRHLAGDELGTDNVSTKGTLQGLLSTPYHFQELFAQARVCANATDHIGIIVTKPPETVCVILPPVSCLPGVKKFILFDSHSRPQLGLDGSYMYFSNSERDLVMRLEGLFIPLPMEPGGTIDYIQDMYNMFEGTVFLAVFWSMQSSY
jgi:hypothetical protein